LPRLDIILESVSASFHVIEVDETAAVDELNEDCSIQMPEQGHLRIGSVTGELTLKGILGTTEVEHLAMDCIARHTGSLSISSIAGDVHVRHAATAVTLGTVNGHVTLRDIDAPVSITYVAGNFWGRNLQAGLHIEQVNGDVALHTDFAPNSSFQLATSGSVLLRVPSSANVRIAIPHQTAIEADESLKIVTEGEQRIVVMGTGNADVRIIRASSVRIRSDETCDMECDCNFAFEGDIDAYMTDVSAKIDAQISQIEARLNDLPGRVRTRVERKLEAAQRKVESALRETEQATYHFESRYGDQIVYAPPREPVSEEERLTILRMLERGTISVQEAENLLAALEKGA
jgi:DUF4097 and DUF4098 domain-containing protein YvlB